MKSESIRRILAIQAIEQSDSEGEILSDSDLKDSAAIAGAPLPSSAKESEIESFLSERAELLQIRALNRHPKTSQWVQEDAKRHRFGFAAIGLLVLAGIVGFFSNELGPDKRINILSFPLLGIIGWSLIVSLREIFLLFRSRESLASEGCSDAIFRWLRPLPPRNTAVESPDSPPQLDAAHALFFRRWTKLTLPTTFTKTKALLHAVAIVLALSAVGGMYLKGLANEYRAVWESTFFADGESLLPFLKVVLGPATSLLGDELPTSAALDSLHWQSAKNEVPGENAARWIHWYALTIGIYVILPRLFFFGFWRLRDRNFHKTLPYRSISPCYFDRLLAISSGTARKFHLVPYEITVEEGRRRLIEKRLETHLEGPVDLYFEEGIRFGEEEEIPSLEVPDSTTIVPFLNFSSTPEKETHLELIHALEKKSKTPIPFLILDATEFDRKSEGLRDSKDRRTDRENAWQHLLVDEPREMILLSAHASATP